ncbi:MAG: hypothetical protein R3245_10570 [Kiloniellales bacterium]|nr:hypothetical protein [Kiloniellales bacterium]
MNRLVISALIVAILVLEAGPAQAQDVAICFDTADSVVSGEAIDEAAKQAGHEACQRALAQTASIVQKYHLQEADFDISGTRPKSE